MNISETLDCLSSSVRKLNAYHLEPPDVPVKLNQNENPFDWPQDVKEEIAEFVKNRPWNRYPDFVPTELKAALAGVLGVAPDQVIAGNGSNEMLLVLLLSCAAASRTVITCQPCFTVYSLLSAGLGYTEKRVFLTDDLRHDAAAIMETCRQNPKAMLILNTPNNPVGCALTEAELRAILDVHRGICVVDQAYVEFGGYNALPLLALYPNLIVTRTFSKAFGAAGLRLGYMAGARELIAEINKIKLPYNINFFTAQVATVLTRHQDTVRQRVKQLIDERVRLVKFLHELPTTALRIYPSSANFILIRTPRKTELFAALRDGGVLVRDVSGYPMLSDCLRLSVGSPQENTALERGLTAFFTSGNR